MKLLIAEDNERLLSTLVRVLEREGYTVDGVNNGALALDYLRASDYDRFLDEVTVGQMLLQLLENRQLRLVDVVLIELGRNKKCHKNNLPRQKLPSCANIQCGHSS